MSSMRDWRLLENAYSLGYDSLNDVGASSGRKVSIQGIREHYGQLKRLAMKYDPAKLPQIEQLERLAILNAQGKISDRDALREMRIFAMRHGLNQDMISQAEARIDAMERSNFGVHIKDTHLPEFKMPNVNKEGKPHQAIREFHLPEFKMPGTDKKSKGANPIREFKMPEFEMPGKKKKKKDIIAPVIIPEFHFPGPNKHEIKRIKRTGKSVNDVLKEVFGG